MSNINNVVYLAFFNLPMKAALILACGSIAFVSLAIQHDTLKKDTLKTVTFSCSDNPVSTGEKDDAQNSIYKCAQKQ